MELELRFEEAVFGKATEVEIRRAEVCGGCRGTGAAQGRGPVTCQQCGGHGQVRYQQGFFSIARTWDHLQRHRPGNCRSLPRVPGRGRQQRQHTIGVNVPAGVEDGTRIRYQGEGDAGRFGGPSGDLYVVLSVKPHEISSGKARTCTAWSLHPFPRLLWVWRLKSERWRERQLSKFPKAPKAAENSVFAGRACPGSMNADAATWWSR